MSVCADYKIPHSEFLSWIDSDRDKAVWWHIRQAEKCPSCGTREGDWAKDHNAFIGDLKRCRGCEIRERTQESVTDADGRGVHVVLKRREDVRRSQ